MRGEPRISGIYHMKNDDPPTGVEEERRNKEARAELWKTRGVAVIDPEDINDDWERQVVINNADKLYGRRGKRS